MLINLLKRKYYFLLICLLAIGYYGKAQDTQPFFGEGQKIRNRHSVGIGIGHINEWRTIASSLFNTDNVGLTININYNFKISENWDMQALLHFDVVNESDISVFGVKSTFLSNAYHLTVSRRVINFKKAHIRTFVGFIFLDELNATIFYKQNANGDIVAQLSDVQKYNTPYTSFGIEYICQLNGQFDTGLRLNGYYDFIGFGRTDITAFIRWNFLRKNKY